MTFFFSLQNHYNFDRKGDFVTAYNADNSNSLDSMEPRSDIISVIFTGNTCLGSVFKQ